MNRFLNNPEVTLPALIETVQDAIRAALSVSDAAVALVVHGWCMFSLNTHTSKKDLCQRTHDKDLGYDMGTALVVDAGNGQPLGPMELRLRTAKGILTTRPGASTAAAPHIDELAGVMADSQRWNLGRTTVHVIDREADSVGHYRAWNAAGHQFVVRAKSDRRVTWRGQSVTLGELQKKFESDFRDPLGGAHRLKSPKHGLCRVQVLETEVVLDRPAKTWIDGVQRDVPGPPLTLRLVMTRVIDPLGVVCAQWLLFTNVGHNFSAATIARWYAWRWRIENYHKLLKTAGMNAEEWLQKSGEAFAKRLVIASMACLTVWCLQQDDSEEAAELKKILIRLSGRQMKHHVKDTAPALLAGLENSA